MEEKVLTCPNCGCESGEQVCPNCGYSDPARDE